MLSFIVFESICLSLFILYLVQEFSAKDVRYYVKFLVFITYLTCFSIVTILPLDIYIVYFLLLFVKRH